MSSKWRLLISVLAIAAAVFSIVDKPIQQGLDLKGGTQIVLDLHPRPGQQLNGDVANRTVEVLRRRVDSLGIAEPNLEVSGNNQIIVELPGVSDPTQAEDLIGKTAQLSFNSVVADLGRASTSTADTSAATSNTTATTTAAPTGTTSVTPTTTAGLGASGQTNTVLGQAVATSTTVVPVATSITPATVGEAGSAAAAATTTSTSTTTTVDISKGGVVPDDTGEYLQLGPSALTGDGVDTATAEPPDQNHTGWYIQVQFKGAGSKAWTQLTGQAACNASGDPKRQVAIVLDGQVISHPEVDASGANPVQCNVGITGDTTEITGQFTAKQAKDLALLIRGGALPVDVSVASKQVIGPELGKDAITASRNAVIVGGVLTIAYILFYYRFLGLLAAFSLGVYGLLSFGTLKGLGLTITLPGIAGFVLAIAMAMDSNVLVYERVKEEYANGRSMRAAAQVGFKSALSAILDSNATTLIAALTLYLFAIGEVKGFGVTLLVGTLVSIFTTLFVLRTLVTGMLSMGWVRDRPRLLGMNVGAKFRKRMSENPPDIMRASKYFLVALVAVVALAVAGIAIRGINYGIEFTGGEMLEYKTSSTVDLDKARQQMGNIGFPAAVVQRSGVSGTSVRVPSLTKDQATQVDSIMTKLGGGSATRLSDTTIGPSFGNDLKHKAFKGLLIGIAIQLLYVAYRFRWTFGIGAVVAMVHDALLVLGLFAWLQKSFDAVFLAALLTVIAYSVNDSVVVFDRIREQRKRRISEPFARVVSDACAQTFPRTLNIALSALFILVALWRLGGQSLSDFALALTVGVVTGVYSSVFIASPIAVLLERWKPTMATRGTTIAASASSSRPKTGRGSTSSTKTADDVEAEEEAKPAAANRPAPRPRKKKRR